MLRLLLAATLVLLGLAGAASAADNKVVIATWRGCEDACRGFQEYLVEKGVDVEFIIRDAAQKEEAIKGILAEARSSNVDLILTWGTNVTQGIAGTLADLSDATYNQDIPQIFMIVADPVGAGVIESLNRTGRPNITGTYNRVPEEVTIETIRAYRPDFKRLGLVYHKNEANSVLKRDEIAALAEELRFEFAALELPLGQDGKPRIEDIAPIIAELKRKGVDFIYLGSSSFLQANADAFTKAAVDHGLPVISPYERLVRKSQALISVAARYRDVGRMAGGLAERILVGGATPGDLPVAQMTDFAIVINLNVAKRLNLFPPLDLLQVAETVN